MSEEELYLLAVMAALAADEDMAQPQPAQFRPLMTQGGGEAAAPPVPAGLDAFQTDTFQNDTFQ